MRIENVMAMRTGTTISTIWEEITANRWKFVFSFAFVLLVSWSLLLLVDFVPERISVEDEGEGIITAVNAGEPSSLSLSDDAYGFLSPSEVEPTRIIIPALDIDETIENPDSRDIRVLDQALSRGVVHYPGSGSLADHSNVFLFGHSSYLPTVNNEQFRVFNELQNLEVGNAIRVQADGLENVYRVRSVRLVDANEALVELSDRQKMLTLSTCNSFGAQTDRFVVEADFVGSNVL